MKTIFTLCMLFVMPFVLLAEYNPIVKAKKNVTIIDVGYQDQDTASISRTSPKVWTQYPGTFTPFEGVNDYGRIISDREACISDAHGNENCPIESASCPMDIQYSSGSTSGKVDRLLEKTKTCIGGTQLNPADNMCYTYGWNVCSGYANATYDSALNTCVSYDTVTTQYIDSYEWGIWYGGNGWSNSDAYGNIFHDEASAANYGRAIAYLGSAIYLGTRPHYTSTLTCPSGTLSGNKCLHAPQCPAYATNRSGNKCYTSPQCETGFRQSTTNPMQCLQNYSFYTYSCPTDAVINGQWAGPVDVGQDCLGACPGGRADGCLCNLATPPNNNCALQQYKCPTNPSQMCTNVNDTPSVKKPMITHMAYQSGLTPGVFGVLVNDQCTENCTFGIRKIYGESGKLCFEKTLGDKECAQFRGCSFTGSISAPSTQWISAIGTNGKKINASNNNGSTLSGELTSTCNLNGAVGFTGRKGPIVGFKSEAERIVFWDQFDNSGYLGFIETTREVASIDAAAGFVPESTTAWNLRDDGFNRIETTGTATYAISSGAVERAQCIALANKYQMNYIPAVAGSPINGGVHIDQLVNNATGGKYNDVPYQTTYVYPATLNIENVCPNGTTFDAATGLCKDGGHGITTIDAAGPICTNANMRLPSATEAQSLPLINNGEIWSSNTFYDLSSGCGHYPRGDYVVAYKGATAYNKLYLRWCNGIHNQNPASAFWCVANNTQRSFYTCPNGGELTGTDCVVPIPTPNRCVLSRENGVRADFIASQFAIKPDSGSKEGYFCSPLTCRQDHSCQSAACQSGTTPTLSSEAVPAPKPSDCVLEVCDANLPYYAWCGKEAGCPVERPNVIKNEQGCFEVTCAEGGYDNNTGKCFKWKCPSGYVESGGSCVAQ